MFIGCKDLTLQDGLMAARQMAVLIMCTYCMHKQGITIGYFNNKNNLIQWCQLLRQFLLLRHEHLHNVCAGCTYHPEMTIIAMVCCIQINKLTQQRPRYPPNTTANIKLACFVAFLYCFGISLEPLSWRQLSTLTSKVHVYSLKTIAIISSHQVLPVCVVCRKKPCWPSPRTLSSEETLVTDIDFTSIFLFFGISTTHKNYELCFKRFCGFILDITWGLQKSYNFSNVFLFYFDKWKQYLFSKVTLKMMIKCFHWTLKNV